MSNIQPHFTEDIRYRYDLTSSSLVLDAGFYHGDFAREIIRRYACRVYAFEPFFYREPFDPHTLLTVFPVGLSNRTTLADFKIKGSMTGTWADGPSTPVVLINICDVVASFPHIDLLKLNIEGGEYDCLEALLDSGLTTRITNLQVQFHPLFEDSAIRHDRIRERLLATHHMTYDFPWVWENFQLTT